MPLNLTTNDGDITPYLKYNAKAGRFYVKPQGGGEDVEVQNPRLAIDMAHIRTGWIFYQEGAGPEKVWDPSATQMAPRPAGPRKFKRGFEVMVFGADPIPVLGKMGLREFGSTATNCITAILAMHADYEAQMAAHPNEVPFYDCRGVKPVQGAYGTNYEPQFILKAWVPLAKIPAFNPPPDDAPVDWDSIPNEPRAVAKPVSTSGNFAPNGRDRAMAHEAPPPRDDEPFSDSIPF